MRGPKIDPDKLPEPKVKELVKDWYDANNGFSWQPVSNGMGMHGIPDRVGCIPLLITQEMVGRRFGLFVAIESKGGHRRTHKDGGLSEQQKRRRNEINDAAGVCVPAYGADFVEAVLEELKKR